ncbi:pollen-specific leucine-rich repeat extensin-like protein 2 [Morus notabilis]|uniref:pollen-specific leucine-rich repeat extensin-like protein 2 n=1 Tax=Morus notabilis TaxID=981085 RepID=UPI000CECEBB2|nr:pollen-specific leucine-rich repeat extensin-like protein 2 [Morus notabilis]
MESRRQQYYCTTFWFFYITISSTILFLQCDARKHAEIFNTQQHHKKLVRSYNIGIEKENHLSIEQPLELSSPFSLPPFDSLSPQNSPPFFVYPPSTPPTSSHAKPEPPPSAYSPLTPWPSPPNHSPSPPPPGGPPPEHKSPPQLYPPPPPPRGAGGSPPEHKRPQFAVWCVAKPTVPDSIMQEAVDYACATGADCKPIQPNGPCYQPNTLLAHASYAFNSYFQNKKRAGGTCDFAGTAMLVTDDPSFDGCLFIYN